jgi:hypothetical protein
MSGAIPPLPNMPSWRCAQLKHRDRFTFTFSASRPALGPTQSSIQWTPESLSMGVKRPRREADHSPPSSAEVKNAWSYTSTLPIRLHGIVLSYSTGTTLILTCILCEYMYDPPSHKISHA